MFRIALISRWHSHEARYTPEILSSQDCEAAVVWDENIDRGIAWAQEIGVRFEPDLKKVLEDPLVNAICVTAPTNMHKKILIAAAKAKKDIFVEKSLALTENDALEIEKAVDENHIHFSIAYIRRTTGSFIFAKRVVESGILGKITMLRIRNGHSGTSAGWLPEYWYDLDSAGGGAITDLGCHQMYLIDWLIGFPESINSSYGFYAGKMVEDSGICVLNYRNGCPLAIIDSSFTSFYTPYTMEIYGTEGTLLVRLDKKGPELQLPKSIRPDWLDEYIGAVEIHEYDNRNEYIVDASALPDEPSPLRQWIDGCTKGTKIHFDIASAVRLSRMVEGANISWRKRGIYVWKP